MQEYLKNRMNEVMKEYNEKTLQKIGLKDQLKACSQRIEQLRGAYAELESVLNANDDRT